MYRKDLLLSAITGASLSLTACLLLTPRETPPPVSAKELIFQAAVKSQQNQPRIVIASSDLQSERAPVSTHAPVLVSNRKPARQRRRLVRTPQVLPIAQPLTENRVASEPGASGNAFLPTSLPVQNAAVATVAEQGLIGQDAREALKEVGSNPQAEAIWTAAINNPDLPAAQRKDLIEDLNEEGFADPKHLTAADLPRIENRMALIEVLAPEAMDQTNADAFQEAYKDLKNMQSRLSQP